MKVLFWTFIGFDKHETSEHLLISVIEQLCKGGHEVHIIQKNRGGVLPSIPRCLSDYPVTTTVIPFDSASKGNLIARYLKDLRYISKCKKYFRSGFDAVFIQSNTVAGYAVKAVRKLIPNATITLNVQDIFPYNLMYCGRIKRDGLLFRMLAGSQRSGYLNSDHIITISEDMKETLIGDGVPEDKISVIYNWSYQDEPYINVDISAVSHMFKAEHFNVVYAGNIGLMQNVDLVIEAARLLKEENSIRFHIIGDGVYKNKLVDKAKGYGLDNVSFWPMLAPEIAPAIYTAADVNVIPLVKDGFKTALPSKTATCLACGKPIILAIGKQSNFGQKAHSATGCPICESDSAEELTKLILEIKDQNIKTSTGEFFMNNFSNKVNSGMYERIITS